MRKNLLATAALAALLPLSAMTAVTLPATAAAATMQVSTATFVKKAAMSDMYEVAAGKIAASKATSADVKSFGSQMVTAHTETSNKMKSLLPSVKPPVMPPSALDAEHQKMIDALNSASAADFDKTYVAQQVAGHEKAVALFTSYSANGTNADLKKFAGDTLPVIQGHLDMAKKLQMH